jgi:hypothetical protein
MPSPHTSPHITAFHESDPELDDIYATSESLTESESHTESESDPDQEPQIENQLELPDYQFGVYTSSPPRVDAHVNCDKLNNYEEGEFFFSKEGLQS